MSLAYRMIQLFCDEGRPLTVDEFARGVRSRTIDVRRVIRDDPRFIQTLPSRQSPKAKVYVVRNSPDPLDGQGQPEMEGAA